MSISTNSLMHFTKNIGSLKKILNGSFNLHYCKEYISLNGEKYKIGIPMVSFCDIPLSQIIDHVEKYGGYGIGLTKQWGKSKGINPILYMEENSLAAYLIEPFIKDAIINDSYGDIRRKYTMEKNENIVNVYPINDHQRILRFDALVSQLSFMKNYEGILARNGKNINYKFYDEREWRYVPTMYDYSESNLYFRPFLTEEEYDEWRNEGTKSRKPVIKGRSLSFNGIDVSYIFVRKEVQISDLIISLKKHKNCLYKTQEEMDLLISRIFSIERIKSDL
jgi:hypothetical protein